METTYEVAVASLDSLRGSPRLLLTLLDDAIDDARVRFLVEDRAYVVGAEGYPCEVTLKVLAPRFFERVLASGNLGLGEAWMEHDYEVEEGTLQDFLSILVRNRLDHKIKARPLFALRILMTRWANTIRGKTHSVQRHYDIGVDLFEAFLDPTLTYSCGYVKDPDDSLEQLQFNKLDRLCQKLRLQESDHLLDIGCGYGGMLIHAARHYGVTGTGITISRHHHEHGNSLIEKAGLSDRVRIEFEDFTKLEGSYDKVVSVGMMEHVPPSEYGTYARRIKEVLKPHGMGLIHCIGANAPKNEHDPFIQKYIFPHSNQPRLSDIAGSLEKQGLAILDVENMVRHYGYTVRRWLQHFKANQGNLVPARHDDSLMRMWEYYLCCGIAGAFYSDAALYQVLFTKDYTAPMPLHRV